MAKKKVVRVDTGADAADTEHTEAHAGGEQQGHPAAPDRRTAVGARHRRRGLRDLRGAA
ncbi:hypothetical protein [Nocardioides sp. B-3]|uniref:hypothetical protein n=1 Tax=Nocardioides sp. B-3 TaxID=2895565 RepID=UPI0021521302|nr:hypothetical protein [Nocardioides sp. B-3]UUZ61150.1 hypothetical protein LP418_11305 [Nocardioides sp. B-3]